MSSLQAIDFRGASAPPKTNSRLEYQRSEGHVGAGASSLLVCQLACFEPVAEEYRSYRHRFEEYVFDQVRQVNVSFVAEREGLSWDEIESIFVHIAQKKYQRSLQQASAE